MPISKAIFSSFFLWLSVLCCRRPQIAIVFAGMTKKIKQTIKEWYFIEVMSTNVQ